MHRPHEQIEQDINIDDCLNQQPHTCFHYTIDIPIVTSLSSKLTITHTFNINPNSRPHHTPCDQEAALQTLSRVLSYAAAWRVLTENHRNAPNVGPPQRGWQRAKPKNPSLHVFTPPKIHTEPDNDGLEDVFPFPRVYSQVQNVNLPGCIFLED